MSTVEKVPLNTIVTTFGFSSLEGPFLHRLLTLQAVRKHLDIGRNVRWQFVSSAILEKPRRVEPEAVWQILRQQGVVYFNVGHAKDVGCWDQHGSDQNQSLCELCSLDIVRGEYDFLKYRPWLRTIYQKVRDNDVDAIKLSENQANLRMLMSGLALMFPKDPQKVLETLSLALTGVFQRAKDSANLDKVFDLDEIRAGVASCAEATVSADFNQLVEEAVKAIDQDWKQALVDVAKAANDRRHTAWVKHPLLSEILGRDCRTLLVKSDCVKVAAAARRQRFDLVIAVRSNGHCQVFSSNMWRDKGEVKFKLDFGAVAHQLRILEAKFAQPRQRLEGGDWTGPGYVYYQNGRPDNLNAPACPWYLAEFRSGLFNGSLSAPDVPPTRIHPTHILQAVTAILPKCRPLKQVGDGHWEHAY